LIKSNRTSYLAGWPDAKLADNIIGKAMQNADIVTHEMPSYLRVRQRGNKLIFVNYGGETATIPDSFSGIFILGTKDVPAAGVSIMQID
jgi:beta-galactosidase